VFIRHNYMCISWDYDSQSVSFDDMSIMTAYISGIDRSRLSNIITLYFINT